MPPMQEFPGALGSARSHLRVCMSITLGSSRELDHQSLKHYGLAAEGTNPMLPPVPNVDGKKIRSWYSPTALAFLGDSVWEVGTLPIRYQHMLYMLSLPLGHS